LDKLFVDLGLGYDFYGYKWEYEISDTKYDDSYDQSSLTITPKVGWKFIFGKGFVVEPSLGYTIGIALGDNHRSANGLNLGVGLGWAF
jgi:outer membrane autotransporter protein